MLKKIKLILTAIGILGATGYVFAKEADKLPLGPVNPTDETQDDCYSEFECDTYVVKKSREIRALYAIPDIKDDRPINKEEIIIEKYGIPNEEENKIKDNYDRPILKYGIPNDLIKENLPVLKYGIPNIRKEK